MLLVDPEALSQLLAPGFDPKEWKRHRGRHAGAAGVARRGLRPGGVHRRDAVEWSNKGKPVILVRRETVPDDIHGMWVSQGILTATGGMTSHAAVVGRQMGKPSIVGAGELRIDEHGKSFTVKGQTVKEGDCVAFDGLTGEVKLAQGRVAAERDPAGGRRQDEAGRFADLPALQHAAGMGRQVPPPRRARQCRPARPGRDRLRVRRPRHRPVPHRAHVLRRGPHSDRPADDPGRQRSRPARGARTSCCRCSGKTSTACSRR